MEGGSASQVENRDENTNHDASNGENTNHDASNGESSSQGTQTIFNLGSLFSVAFPPGPEFDELVSDNDEDDEGQGENTMCSLCSKSHRKLYIIPPRNKTSFKILIENVANSEGGYGIELPERVCWDCNEILTSMTEFRTRAIQTSSLLDSLSSPFVNEHETSAPPPGSRIPATPRCAQRRPDDPSEESNAGPSGTLSIYVLQQERNQHQPQGELE